MKKLVTLLVSAFLIGSSAFAQVADTTQKLPVAGSEKDTVYVEQMPEPGYDVGKYISKHARFPKDALKAGVSGKVKVKFVVDEKGLIKDVSIAESLYPSIDSAAKKLIQGLPKWRSPGISNGKPVKVYYTLPIKYYGTDVDNKPDIMPR